MSEPQLRDILCEGPAGPHRMAWWQWGPADAADLVVCVHGLGRQGRDFDVLARALLDAAQARGRPLRVVCPDVAGRGRSEWLADPQHYVPPTYAGDMLTLLQALHQEAPIGRLGWVGTSMGGLIGMVLFGSPGLPLPVPLHRLVLNDVGPVTQWESIRRIQGYLGQPVQFPSEEAAARALWAVSATFGPHTPEQWLALTKPMLRPLPPEQGGGFTLHYDPAIAVPVRAATEQTLREAEPVVWALYERITAPTLLLRGAESDLLTPATAQAMAERGPKARVVEFAGVGHAPTLVAGNQVEVVTSFLLAED